jgi:hypothetical protein
MRADAGKNRSDDSRGGVEDAKFIADINVNRAGRESSGGNAVNGICASVSDIKEAVDSIRENRVVWVTGDCEAVRSKQGEERFRLAGGAGVGDKRDLLVGLSSQSKNASGSEKTALLAQSRSCASSWKQLRWTGMHRHSLQARL